MAFKRLIRFVPASNASSILLGEPVEAALDVGRALRSGQDVQARVFSGKSALEPGSLTDKIEKVGKVLSPLTQKEAGTIRCIGLNVSLSDSGGSSRGLTVQSTSSMQQK